MWSPSVLQLAFAVMVPPVVVGTIVMLSGEGLAERHHLHHDTYAVSPAASRSLVLVMIFMAVLGCLTGWLSHLGVFAADPRVPLWFFVAFEIALAVMLLSMSRYRVMVYEDRLVFRPAIGRTREIRYENITRMRRVQSMPIEDVLDLLIEADEGPAIQISGILDIEQILLRIDRFDVLAR